MSSRFIARKNRFPWVRPVHARRKLLVRMDTTNHCNLRCSMCPMRLSDTDDSRNWLHMHPDVFQRIREQVFPISRIVGLSCGAEPLTNPDFPEHLKALYRSGVPYRQMVTNGTLLSEPLIRRILEYPPTSLFVSIDGATAETHSRIRDGADLSRIISMLSKLIEARGGRKFPMVGFSTTLQRDNLRELPGIVELAARTGAVSAGVVPLVPYEGLKTIDKVIRTDSEEASRYIDAARLKASSLGISFHLSEDLSRGDSAHPCPYLSNTVYIDPHGSIFPCPYWNTENPAGNIMDGFEKIWKGSTYERLRKGDFLDEDNCRTCPEITRGREEVLKGKQ